MSTIVVTGCAGFIGSHLSEQLLNEGNQLIGIDNFDPYYDRKVKERNLSGFINHPNFRFLEIDLADYNALTESLKDVQIDVIV